MTIVLLACDRAGAGARDVSAPGPAPSHAALPGGSLASTTNVERWPSRPTTEGGFTAGIVDYRPPAREPALLTDVRSAKHESFDRVVFELGQGSAPGYHVEYIDRPVRRCGSGDVTSIAGDAWLEVRLEPANAHTASGAATIVERERTTTLPVLRELEQTCDFEAQVTWVLGVAKPSRYRVLTLDAPLRLVIDFEH